MKNKFLVALGVVLSVGVLVAARQLVRSARYDLDACQMPNLVQQLAARYDYVELRQDFSRDPPLSAGTPCANAKDRETCLENASKATSTAGWTNGNGREAPRHLYVVATKGDEVFVIDDAKLTVVAALAPIDTPEKAVLAVLHSRNTPLHDCKRAARKVNGGFEVHLSTDSCFGPHEEVVFISTDGTLDVLEQWSGPQTCVG